MTSVFKACQSDENQTTSPNEVKTKVDFLKQVQSWNNFTVVDVYPDRNEIVTAENAL